MTHGLRLAAALVLLMGGAGAGQAQDEGTLSAEEITARFQAQATRGISIVPSDGTATDATDATAALPEDTTYVAVDESAQVNIQIAFDFDSAAISAGQVSKLDTLCEVIKVSDLPSFRIIGHTDSSGTESYNQNLSTLRAEEVKRHLVNECGIASGRLVAQGVGEAFPVDTANPKADVNRRVEFQVGS